MLVESLDGGRFELRRKDSFRPQVLMGCAFLVFATLPWLEPGMSTSRAAASAAFLVASLACFWRGRPRHLRRVLDLNQQKISDSSHHWSLKDASEIALGGGDPESGRDLVQQYRAEIVFRSGDRVVLLEDANPSNVLRDLAKVRARWPLPIRPGWGLDGANIEALLKDHTRESGSESEPPAVLERKGGALELYPQSGQREIGTAVTVGGVGISLVIALLFGARVERGQPIAPLSVGLAITLVACVFVVAVLLRTIKVRVQSSPMLTVSHHCLGIQTRSLSIERRSVRGVFAVSPTGMEPMHVLLATPAGAVSVEAPGSQAEKLLQLLSGA